MAGRTDETQPNKNPYQVRAARIQLSDNPTTPDQLVGMLAKGIEVPFKDEGFHMPVLHQDTDCMGIVELIRVCIYVSLIFLHVRICVTVHVSLLT